MLEANLPRRALELVLDWAELHQAALLENWRLCRGKQQPHRIDPLADVTAVRPDANWTLSVQFADGLSGRIRFQPDFFTGVFAPLQDHERFAQVFVDRGAVAWPGNIDLAPDAMYADIRRLGEQVLTGQPADALA